MAEMIQQRIDYTRSRKVENEVAGSEVPNVRIGEMKIKRFSKKMKETLWDVTVSEKKEDPVTGGLKIKEKE